MSTRRPLQPAAVGLQIRDRAFYDALHGDDAKDQSHVAEMERDALYYLEGLRRRDQENPAIARELDRQA